MPSPSLSPAARKALVSLSVRALPLALKFCRNSLQEEHRPVIHPATLSRVNELLWFSLQLFLLNEAAVVLVNDGESLLDVSSRLGGQADLGEESLVVEGVSSCMWREEKENMSICHLIKILKSKYVQHCYSFQYTSQRFLLVIWQLLNTFLQKSTEILYKSVLTKNIKLIKTITH